MLGKSTSECLEAKEIVDGIRVHYASLALAEANAIITDMQEPWDEGTSLTKHVVAQASKFADLRAGGRRMLDAEGKATLGRSLKLVTRNPIYAGLTEAMTVRIENKEVSYPDFVSRLLTELRKEQYTELNADRKAGEAVLALKEKQSREDKFKEKQKSKKNQVCRSSFGRSVSSASQQ